MLLTLSMAVSCKKGAEDILENEAEIQQLRERLCIAKDLPVEYLIFKEETGTIEEIKPEVYKDQFLVRLDKFQETPLISCKLSENFKINGLKIKLTGTAYQLKCIKTSSNECVAASSVNGYPVEIKSIVPL